ncbi:MAG: DUF4445 domain-containing protein [Geobacter sp.]|nr:DUF4445 domain-containing protein [Geobacter sp.]
MLNITFHPNNKTVQVPPGTTILAAARLAGVTIETPCNGAGHCGKCVVRVDPALLDSLVLHAECQLAGEGDGLVLACHAEAVADLTVYLVEKEEKGLKIVTAGVGHETRLKPHMTKRFDAGRRTTRVFAGGELLAEEPGDTSGRLVGAAIDIGTTTLVVSLVDLLSGRELVSLSALNPQSLHAQDVLSRIRFASEANGLRTMQRDVINALNLLIAEGGEQAGIAVSDIHEAVFSGNTCMLHLAAGVDPAPIGKCPFIPALRGGSYLAMAETGVQGAPAGIVYLPPVISGYVGADITAGMLAARLTELPGTILFIDIGTNGEMILAVDGRLTATSTAAGPAFEGMNISCGMRAARGAVEYAQVEEDGALAIRTIGETEPSGICGSGLLDLVGELVRTGMVGKSGRFADPADPSLLPLLAARLTKADGKTEFRVSERVYLTQKDVRQVQLAKGAIRAGIEFLLKEKGVAVADIDRVLIAGSFGYHLREESLITLGLLPRGVAGKVSFLGNTSRTGAEMLLINGELRSGLEKLVLDVEQVELTARADFDKVFVDAMGF